MPFRPLVATLVLATLVVLPSPALADRVDDLVNSLLADPSYKVRTQAALVLGKLGDRKAVGGLTEALKDESDAVRGSAALSLGKLGDPSSLGALEALRSDASSFVRQSVDKALAMMPRAAPPAAAVAAIRPTAGARFYVAVDVTPSSHAPDAARLLREALTLEVARLPSVTTSLDGAPGPALPTALAARKLTGWMLHGNITNLKVANGQLDCDVSLAIATLSTKQAIRATASAGASVSNVSGPSDAGAQRDCLNGAAQQLAEEVGKFLRTVK